MTIGESMRAVRQSKGMKLNAASNASGVSYRSIQDYELGRVMPGVLALTDLADAYGVSIDQLVGYVNKHKKIGSWLPYKDDNGGYFCGECGCDAPWRIVMCNCGFEVRQVFTKFCPNCGNQMRTAQMQEEVNNE